MAIPHGRIARDPDCHEISTWRKMSPTSSRRSGFLPDDWRITFSREDLTYTPCRQDALKDKDIAPRLRD
jgi:hypothetical protein